MVAHSRSILSAFVLLTVLALSACGVKYDRTVITYRLDAQVRVNGEVLSGSTVQAIWAKGNSAAGSPSLSPYILRSQGQAIELATTRGGVVFLLMDGRNGAGGYEDLLLKGCGIVDRLSIGIEFVEDVRRFTGSCDVRTDHVPLVVTLDDPDDPATMAIGNDTVEIVRLRLTRVNEPVPLTLRGKYSWLEMGPWTLPAEPNPMQIFSDEFWRGPPRGWPSAMSQPD